MQFHPAFEPLSDEYPLPEKVLKRAEALRPKLLMMEVGQKLGRNSFNRVCKITFKSMGDGTPAFDAEELTLACVQAAEWHADEKGCESHYRVVFHLPGKNGKGTERKYAQFKAGGEFGPEDVLDRVEAEDAMVMAFGKQNEVINMLIAHVETTQERLLAIAQSQAAQTEPIMGVWQKSMETFRQGLAMSVSAAMASAEAVRESRKEETDAEVRMKMIDMLQSILPIVGGQFATFLKRAMAQDGENSEDDNNPKSKSPPAEKSDVKPTDPHSPTPEADPSIPPEAYESPLIYLLSEFFKTVTPSQWSELGQKLTKKQFGKLTAITKSTSEEDAYPAVLEFEKVILPDALKVAQILDAEQTTALLALFKMLEDAKAQAAEAKAKAAKAQPKPPRKPRRPRSEPES